MIKETLSIPEGCQGALWPSTKRDGAHKKEHIHNELEVNLVISGQAYYLVDHVRYDLTAGSQIWLFPKHPHVIHGESKNFKMWIAVFTKELLTQLVKEKADTNLLEDRYDQAIAKHLDKEALKEMEALITSTQACSDTPLLFNKGLAFILLRSWDLHQKSTDHEKFTDIDDVISDIVKRVREQPGLNLDQLSDEFHCSQPSLSRRFYKQVGVHFSAYKSKLALDTFMNLWQKNWDANITHLALDSGFGSYPQFHRVFKDSFGYGPAEYKRRRLKGK